MTLSTSALRREWAPHCPDASKRTTVDLHGDGRVNVLTTIIPAVQALDACLRAHGYRTRRADTGAYNCRRITGGTGYSLHAYAIAVDINWQSNPYGPRLVTDMPPAMVDAIKAIRTRNGKQVWGWGGDYRTNKDAMHFEVVCTRADLATGIAGTTPTTNPDEEALMALTRETKDEIRKIIQEELAPVKRGIMLDEASDEQVAGSLRGWLVAIAKKVGATREEAIANDPWHAKHIKPKG